jgi:hypothetical protein
MAAEDGDIDVSGLLNGNAEKIKVLMRRDPKFIGRLITVRRVGAEANSTHYAPMTPAKLCS